MEERHPICGLCGRPIPPDVPQSLHHLVPKLRGGKGGPVVLLHQICHSEIHATLTETELARDYSTLGALRAHPRIAKFIGWVSRRPPGFRSKIPAGPRKRRRPGRGGL
ncbi:HNH endonuclease [Palleronia sediminis]|uniref:HNH endonuclease n=1 Tax=Palleronia sediminis TaxID=2547833 RepID=A0A4R6AKY4_9RHOB|nr:HNH endonuclease [Palleronia sediminis]TDL84277.1 HNH endonuclease [Palleronia sediminis]